MAAIPVDTVWHTSDSVYMSVCIHIVWHGGAHFDSLQWERKTWKSSVVLTLRYVGTTEGVL